MTANYLFRIERVVGTQGGLLGYEWVEVLAIEPWALGRRPADHGDWCDRTISVHYVCLTNHGLVRIQSGDFWTSLEEFRDYESDGPASGGTGVVISVGDRSVVQVGSTNVDGVNTGDHAALGFQVSDDLVRELAELRAALRDEERDHGTLGTDLSIGALAEAEVAAREGDERRLVASLRKVGTEAVSTARDLGVGLAGAAIAKAAGI